ncbi:uncharacterized protein L969DRAFT_467329 [Mixia osmundae IAM 14324]|uniref:uncharacterized protein n=1 Tax=Mixia osmundae (strain CBS 9802 / IAM 14324 / JCM 22182 / KY 12970) TaxID=764103 RepID=UPI0004A55908|nr:uncharacterized protein L969DRAFT_467329 [Mixia osmundae IAM 14324]KEI39753.1 hypothetical protein L969DRAFT_467329 [Mixia osmundae IAM 14324]
MRRRICLRGKEAGGLSPCPTCLWRMISRDRLRRNWLRSAKRCELPGNCASAVVPELWASEQLQTIWPLCSVHLTQTIRSPGDSTKRDPSTSLRQTVYPASRSALAGPGQPPCENLAVASCPHQASCDLLLE